MIQEKDFLYRVPVKTAPITTPRGQIRNPEILVDLEGGEFMHGNILDANSTNKLINQSVKDAVDDKFIESGYVTKGLLEAETSARTKGDEDLHTALNQAITEKADASALANEVTRATGAESGLQAAIATKADATALSNYVLTTALNQQVDTLNAAIDAKIDDVSILLEGLSRKQDRITVNEVDITDIETADITKLRTIVTNLINALYASGLIAKTKTIE